MKNVSAWAIIISLIWFFTVAPGSVANAQSLKMPNDSPLPTEPILTKTRLGKDSELKSGPMRVFVNSDNTQPLSTPSKSALPFGGPLNFMSRYFCFASHKNAEENITYYLLGDLDAEERLRRHLGWIDEQQLILETSARKDPKTGIVFKTMVLNTREGVEKTREYSPVVGVRKAPDLKAEIVKKLPLYQLNFTYGEDKAKEFVLIGSSPRLNWLDEKETEKQILGWIPKARAVHWPTRQALEYDEETTKPTTPRKRESPALIYKTPDAANQVLRDPKKKQLLITQLQETRQAANDPERLKELLTRFRETGTTGLEVFSMESWAANKTALPKPHDQLRFPVLPDPKRGNRETFSVMDNTLYHVGGIGGFGDLSFEETERIKSQLNQIRQGLKTIEILFVIDDTESMEPWIHNVAKNTALQIIRSVQKTNEAVEGDNKSIVKMGVAFYHDDELDSQGQPRTEAVVQVEKLQLLDNEGEVLRRFEDLLGKHPIKKYDQDSPHERMFSGIIQGVADAGFSSNATKMIILIGDCGNWPKGPREAKVGGEEKLGVENVISSLTPPGETPFNFYSFQVLDPGPDLGNPAPTATRDFRDQVKAIQAGLKQAVKAQAAERKIDLSDEELSSSTGYMVVQEGSQVESKTLEYLDKLRQKVKKLEDEVNLLRQGQFGATLSPNTMIALENNRINISKLRQIKTAQLFDYGYIWEYAEDVAGAPKARQIRRRLLISYRELDFMIKLIEGMVLDLDDASRSTARDFEILSLEEMAGQAELPVDPAKPDRKELFNMSKEEILNLSRGLKFRDQALQNRLENNINRNDFRLKPDQLLELWRRKKLLEDIREGFRTGNETQYTYLVNPDSTGFNPKTHWMRKSDSGKPAPRGFSLPFANDIAWFWIDYEEEWP